MFLPNKEPSTILIIDDNVVAIRLLADMLKDLGQIKFSATAEGGLDLARKFNPHLILLDVEMPSMDGYDVCKELKADPLTSGASVIFVTAEKSTESEIKALQGGAVDFISKPLNHLIVRARVEAHLKIQQQAAALRRLANRDGLTGLFNRRYFDQAIEMEFLRHRRQQLSLAVAFVDIDHFKPFNDAYGHLQGDACLARVASALEVSTKRPGEFVSRYGGEEFVAVLPYIDLDGAEKYGATLCEAVQLLNIPHSGSSVGNIATISVGVAAIVPDEGSSVQQLIERADQALYRAKAEGRNRVVTWNAGDTMEINTGVPRQSA
jgi:diguanylate cyclase (GGDEF)-like protein